MYAMTYLLGDVGDLSAHALSMVMAVTAVLRFSAVLQQGGLLDHDR
jgi:hypothetical protein